MNRPQVTLCGLLCSVAAALSAMPPARVSMADDAHRVVAARRCALLEIHAGELPSDDAYAFSKERDGSAILDNALRFRLAPAVELSPVPAAELPSADVPLPAAPGQPVDAPEALLKLREAVSAAPVAAPEVDSIDFNEPVIWLWPTRSRFAVRPSAEFAAGSSSALAGDFAGTVGFLDLTNLAPVGEPAEKSVAVTRREARRPVPADRFVAALLGLGPLPAKPSAADAIAAAQVARAASVVFARAADLLGAWSRELDQLATRRELDLRREIPLDGTGSDRVERASRAPGPPLGR